ncbi:ATP-binding protein [Fodinisporobacter ferrooxydans]|uniref:ATP-binding protein n=1 Tax=Fodinisporobacter ferrooxydans TaxID=2901836 RepID=A0ABY4CHY5_9BACL|nr:ATP-binding protein [Alicyclobacillaceae bacterium MYW30-H2]
MQHIGSALSDLGSIAKKFRGTYTIEDFYKNIPELKELNLSRDAVSRGQIALLDYLKQKRICKECKGYENCGKMGDAQGMTEVLGEYNGELIVRTHHCQPYMQWQELRRVERFKQYSGRVYGLERFAFSNFPAEQRKKFPKLYTTALQFSDTYQVGEASKGLYIFGPPGVGKTHLLLAIVNRLTERRIPCIFIRAETIFDKLRSLIGSGQDVEPIVETYCQVPVLAIDEFAQERANEFTIDRIFRIINYRFNAQLPTLFTSNYEPPAIYGRVSPELQQMVDALKSRIVQMNRHGRLDGEDARLRDIQFLDR